MEYKPICSHSQPGNRQPCPYTTTAVAEHIRGSHSKDYWHYCPEDPCFLLDDSSHVALYLHLTPAQYAQYVQQSNALPSNPSQQQQQEKPLCPNTPCPHVDDRVHKEKYWHQCKYGKHCKDLAEGATIHLSRFKHELDEPMKEMCRDGYACQDLGRENAMHKNTYMHVCKKGPVSCTSRNDPVHLNRFVHFNTPFEDPDKTLGWWDPMPATLAVNYVLSALPFNTHEFSTVKQTLLDNAFPATKTIQSIHRVQNPTVWQKYMTTRRLMHARNNGVLNEKWLFHGMKTKAALDSILQDGFDARVSQVNGSIGACVYFAVQASYSVNGYCYVENGVGHLFVARVLTGHAAQGQTQQRDVTINPATSAPFDSVFNGTAMFGVFNNAQAYPAYLIKFT